MMLEEGTNVESSGMQVTGSALPAGGQVEGVSPAEAWRCARAGVGESPGDPDAWRHLGEVQHQLGQAVPAVASLRRAVDLAPRRADLMARLAQQLSEIGRKDEAAHWWERATREGPAHPAWWVARARAARQSGNIPAALEGYHRALEQEQTPQAFRLGAGAAAAFAAWRHEALECARAAQAWGRVALWLEWEEHAHAGRPNPARWRQRVEALLRAGDVRGADRVAEEFRRRHPEAPAAQEARVQVWMRQAAAALRAGCARRLEQAWAWSEQVLQEVSGAAEAWANLGTAANRLGDLTRAEAAERRALALRPEDAQLHVNLGLTLLKQGCWREGWAEYEHRWETPLPAFRRRDLAARPWRGQNCPDEDILVFYEQGLGDTLQFSRFLPRLTSQFRTVYFWCQPALVDLLGASLRGVQVVSAQQPAPRTAWQVPLMSLPHRLGLATDAEHASRTLLRPPYAPGDPEDGRPPEGRRRVGLVWAGNPVHDLDHVRSIPRRALAPLASVPGTEWQSLQVGPRASELAWLPWLRDRGRECHSFVDTARRMMGMDLIVSVDSSPIHLAGALGRPAILLLPDAGVDWRWGQHPTSCLWYPSVRLWRRRRGETWLDCLARLAGSLPAWPY